MTKKLKPILLAEISDVELGLKTANSTTKREVCSIRLGARGILFDKFGRVALVFENTYNHYKLPGGRPEPNETLEETLRRELLEETGANIKIKKYLGYVDSYLDVYSEKCTQHYFIAHVIGNLESNAWINEEKDHGCEVIWAKNLTEAIKLVEGANSPEYVHLFEKARELVGLRAALEN
jgi:8-oxo-dGTP pyrophosphatase MutT (NUDIX family)